MSAPRTFAFVSLTATGPDARVDRVFRLAARIPDGRGGAHDETLLANPALDLEAPSGEAVSARLHRLYGVSGAELAAEPPAAELFAEFRALLGERALITFEREETLRWWRQLAEESGTDRTREPVIVGVADLARLVLPGRRSGERERLLALAFTEARAPRGEPTPSEVEALLGALARAFLSRADAELVVAASALTHVLSQLRSGDPAASRLLEASLDLLDRPSAWRSAGDVLFAPATELTDGELSRHAGPAEAALEAYEVAVPRLTADIRQLMEREPLPDTIDRPIPLTEKELAALDEIFREWLPREIASIARHGDPRAFYREGQHLLARRIAAALCGDEVLLIDAPTGTGKTMAYLIPALLRAHAADARLGISTFTIALQEQVFDRELPRALALLERAGFRMPGVRAAVLKGRERYLCGRALRAAAPESVDPPEIWLAWTIAALFALDDSEGDLDRLARRFPLALERATSGEESLRTLLREVRCRPACCQEFRDDERCGAWVARRRAERSHLVVSNHAFVLRNPLFLRNLVADECDHLHGTARGAADTELSLKQVREELEAAAGSPERPFTPDRARRSRLERALLPRVERALVRRGVAEASPILATVAAGTRAAEEAREALALFDRVAGEYAAYAAEAERRGPAIRHAAFRTFALEHPAAGELRRARKDLAKSLSELSGVCKDLAGSIGPASLDDGARLKGGLLRSASDLAETAQELGEWLPIVEDEVRFDATCFYDLEIESGRGRSQVVLKRSILLPQRWLAERYFPSMQACVLLSASTWLKGGFDLARGYLGLDLLEAGSEARDPRPVAGHRAPSAFDYSRVLLAVPDDVPEVSFADAGSRARFDRYLESLLRFLGERTRGRTLVLLTNAKQCDALGRALDPFFRSRRIPLFWQGMEGRAKEELPRLFRSSEGGVLMGVDTFWYGVDFPGDLLEYLVIAKLPFGAPDPYSEAQQAALGKPEFLKTIYLPEALAMFRQGFGRLMRRETDRGAVLVLDGRVLSRWRSFLNELPGRDAALPEERRLQEVTDSTQECVRRALAHCGRLEECRRLGLELRFDAQRT